MITFVFAARQIIIKIDFILNSAKTNFCDLATKNT
jgi:hypothetical protein